LVLVSPRSTGGATFENMKTKAKTLPQGISVTELSRWIDQSGERPRFCFQLELTGPGGSAVFPYSGGIMAFTDKVKLRFVMKMSNCPYLDDVVAGRRLKDRGVEKKALETLLGCSKPDPLGLLYSLVMDSSAADTSFEDWASEYGYDTDSRKALEIFQQCQDQTRKFRRVVGPLREKIETLVQDY
jgi:hypothetical protein